jgi:hypothetical protein
MYSHDGVKWEQARIPAEEHGYSSGLAAAVYGNGTFLSTPLSVFTAGELRKESPIYRSADGKKWERVLVPSFPPDHLDFARGKFIAVRGRQLRSSVDGAVFNGQFGRFEEESACCTGFAFGDTEAGFRYVAVGVSRTLEVGVPAWRSVSSDGLTWDVIDRPAEVGSIAYGAGHFVMLCLTGAVETSHDGQTWVRRPAISRDAFQQLSWTGERFLALGQRTWSSPDGFEWQLEPTPFPGAVLWIAAGRGALCKTGSRAVVFSPDGRNWRETNLPKDGSVHAIAYRSE